MTEPLILDGTAVARNAERQLAERVEVVKRTSGRTPILATILIGDDPASATYVRMKGNACRRVGMESKQVAMPADTTTEQLLSTIGELNGNPAVQGILLQHPVPPGVDERAAFDSIAVDKDVDGVTALGFGTMAMGAPAYGSATPAGILRLLDHYEVPIEGRHAVVIGRSPILGKPVARMLLNRHATVTICHSRTRHLIDLCRQADVLVAAVGKPRFVQGDWIKTGAVIVDAGFHPDKCGDVDLETAAPRSSAYTPVPGGVGPMTISTLILQTVEAAEKAAAV